MSAKAKPLAERRHLSKFVRCHSQCGKCGRLFAYSYTHMDPHLLWKQPRPRCHHLGSGRRPEKVHGVTTIPEPTVLHVSIKAVYILYIYTCTPYWLAHFEWRCRGSFIAHQAVVLGPGFESENCLVYGRLPVSSRVASWDDTMYCMPQAGIWAVPQEKHKKRLSGPQRSKLWMWPKIYMYLYCTKLIIVSVKLLVRGTCSKTLYFDQIHLRIVYKNEYITDPILIRACPTKPL